MEPTNDTAQRSGFALALGKLPYQTLVAHLDKIVDAIIEATRLHVPQLTSQTTRTTMPSADATLFSH
jgi:hypothetical protein